MTIKVSGGKRENGTVVGNTFNKYGSSNPIVKWMMRGFESCLMSFVQSSNPKTITEIGCGEGFWVLKWNKQGRYAKGYDFSLKVIEIAKKNALDMNLNEELFSVKNIYELDMEKDSADLIVCCEVLEHLEFPEEGLKALQQVATKNVIISVPREPIWCLLNMMRGKYLTRFGNTEGHIQNWSTKGIVSLVSQYFEVVEVKTPLPWTIMLCRPLKK